MGLSDRDYLRDEEARYGGSAWNGYSITAVLIGINVAVFLVDAIFAQQTSLPGVTNHPVMKMLMVSPEVLTQPWLWWKFLTAGFAHDPNGISHILFNMLGLFFFGSEVERAIGRREYLRGYLLAIILGNLAFALREFFFVQPPWHSVLGASGAVTAVIVLFICKFPTRMLLLYFVIPVPAWVVGILIIGSNIWGAFSDHSLVAHDVHLVGAGLALAYWRFGWNLSAIDPTDWFLNLKHSLTRPKLKVHAPEDERSYASLDAEADRLLAKVGRDGLASLTARERQVLEDYSRRTRQKLR